MLLLRWALLAICLTLLAPCRFSPPANSQEATASDESHLGIIVVSTSDEAAAILNRLRAGADFGVLAKEKSIDPSAVHGGYLEGLTAAQLRPEFRDALNGVKTGEFTGIVHVPAGFAILTVLSASAGTEDLNSKRILDSAKAAVVRSSINVSGLTEADAVFQEYPKPEGWNRDLRQVCAIRTASHAAAVKRLEQTMPAGDAPADQYDPVALLRAHAAMAQLHEYVGDMDKAVNQWLIAYRIAQSSVPGAIAPLQQVVGVTYLHKSEMENGAFRDSGSQDIFPPLNPSAHYEKQDDSKQAIQYFLQYLQQQPDDMQTRWLLNLAYMTLGGYPAKVPPAYLIPMSSFESKENIGRFRDVAPAAGLNIFSEAGGVVVDDFDNDGLLDVIASSYDMCEPMHYFHNNGDGTFTDRSVAAGLSDQLGGLNILQADYNNDGCMDLLVLRGAWEFPVRRSLLRNNCDGTFTDVTEQSGLEATVTQSQTAVWADIDNDGYLDLFIGNENSPSQLFHNRGDGTFEDISHSAGIDKVAYTKGVAGADYDNDGFVDFYVSNLNGANFLYRNNHDRTFTEVAQQAGVQAPYYSFAAWFFDYDNDGWPDLFVTCYFNSVDQVIRSYLGLPHQVETLKLYRNLHNGAFQDVTAQVGLDRVYMPMGANFGDIDNDGFLDIYLGGGQPSLASIMPHLLLRNKDGKAFVDITASSGTGDLHKGHGISFADLERSGHEDIVASMGGSVPADKHVLRVFENPGNDNDWINVRLVGAKSNRAAIGAQIKITVQDDSRSARTIYRTVGDTSSFGGNPMEQHIGLGHRAQISSLDIWWPATNTRQHFVHVGKNQYIAIQEFANNYMKLDRPPYRLGRGGPSVAANHLRRANE